jgi:hypothetical protein
MTPPEEDSTVSEAPAVTEPAKESPAAPEAEIITKTVPAPLIGAKERQPSIRVLQCDPLYTVVVQYFAQYTRAENLMVSTLLDYRNLACWRLSLDYGMHAFTNPLGLSKDHLINRTFYFDHQRPSNPSANDACLVLTSDSHAANYNLLIHIAEQPVPRALCGDSELELIPVHSWDNGWHQRQSVALEKEDLSPSQQEAMNYAQWFYGHGQFYKDRKLPFQTGILLGGPSGCGKQFTLRKIAREFRKNLCYFPLMESTYSSLGPALACAPLNSILVLDHLPTFYSTIPYNERSVFLRHVETQMRVPIQDPRGIICVCLLPQHSPSELLNFLHRPSRFPRLFDLSISHEEQVKPLLDENLSELDEEDRQKLTKKCLEQKVPTNILKHFFLNRSIQFEAKDPENSADNTPAPSFGKSPKEDKDLCKALIDLLNTVKEERKQLDGAPLERARERFYT